MGANRRQTRRSATTNMDLRLISLTLLLSAASATINLATWDGASATTFKFTELNDPVMGGQSSGTFAIGALIDSKIRRLPCGIRLRHPVACLCLCGWRLDSALSWLLQGQVLRCCWR